MLDMGSTLKQRREQYICSRDEHGTWRILDSWHESLMNIGPDDDVPDNSPAVTLISEGKFIELIKTATQLGFLENATIKGESARTSEEVETLQKSLRDLSLQNVELIAENKNLKDNPKVPMSENFQLKEKALNALLKLALSSDIVDLQ